MSGLGIDEAITVHPESLLLFSYYFKDHGILLQTPTTRHIRNKKVSKKKLHNQRRQKQFAASANDPTHILSVSSFAK